MPTPYDPGSGSVNPKLRALPRKELVRNLDQHARAVAGFRIASASAAMRQIDQDLDAFLHDLVRLVAIQIHHEAHAAGVVLMTWVIESLFFGRVGHSSEYLSQQYHVNRIYGLAILAVVMLRSVPVDYENLKLFRDIAQTRSFSRAAAMNQVSQSAASQHVQDLERTLGIILLDRSTRPLVVNSAGQLYSDFCRDVLRRKEEFEVALHQLKHDVDGTVKIAAIYSVGLSEMAQLENEFSRRQPKAHLEVEYLRPEKVYSAVLADQADLGLVSYPEPSREITVIPWRQEEMVWPRPRIIR